MDARLALIGLLVGLVVGFSGIGGSSFMTPLLILFMHVNPVVAVGTDLVYSVPTKLVGAWVHIRQGTVSKRVVLLLCLGGIPGAIIGVSALGIVRAHIDAAALNLLAKRAVGIVLLVAAAMMALTPLLQRRKTADLVVPLSQRPASRAERTPDRTRSPGGHPGQLDVDRQRIDHVAGAEPVAATARSALAGGFRHRLRGAAHSGGGGSASGHGQCEPPDERQPAHRVHTWRAHWQ
jgi:hypothetical protein